MLLFFFLLYYFVIGEMICLICYLNAPKHLKCNAVFMYKNITFSTLMMLDNDLASLLWVSVSEEKRIPSRGCSLTLNTISFILNHSMFPRERIEDPIYALRCGICEPCHCTNLTSLAMCRCRNASSSGSMAQKPNTSQLSQLPPQIQQQLRPPPPPPQQAAPGLYLACGDNWRSLLVH